MDRLARSHVNYREGYGKFSSRMAAYLWDLSLDGFGGDDFVANVDWGEGCERYGRRVLCWDSKGFVDVDTYPTVKAAEYAMEEYAAFVADDDDA